MIEVPSDHPVLDALNQRLNQLEASNRLLARHNTWLTRGLGGLVLLLLGALLLQTEYAQGQPKPTGQPFKGRVVEAERFVLRDAKGKSRAILGMLQTGPGLAIFDTDDKPRIAFGINQNGPLFSLSDVTGKELAYLAADDAKGEVGLVIRNGAGEPQIALGLDRTIANLQISDDAGKMKAILSTGNKKATGLELIDPLGKRRAALVLDVLAGVGLELRDETGRLLTPRP